MIKGVFGALILQIETFEGHVQTTITDHTGPHTLNSYTEDMQVGACQRHSFNLLLIPIFFY